MSNKYTVPYEAKKRCTPKSTMVTAEGKSRNYMQIYTACYATKEFARTLKRVDKVLDKSLSRVISK